MKKSTVSNVLEILLFTSTTFSKRELCEKNTSDSNPNLAPKEQLEAACWNGMLDELLPEILHDRSFSEKIFLWQIEMQTSYLRLGMAPCPFVLENQFTVDPYHLFATQKMN